MKQSARAPAKLDSQRRGIHCVYRADGAKARPLGIDRIGREHAVYGEFRCAGIEDAAIVETLADPAVQQRLKDLGQESWPRDKQTPEALAAQQKAEIEKWWPIIKAANIRAE